MWEVINNWRFFDTKFSQAKNKSPELSFLIEMGLITTANSDLRHNTMQSFPSKNF